MSDLEAFRHTVETFLRLTHMSPTSFGRKAAGDPAFVFDLRTGREPRSPTRDRVLRFIDAAAEGKTNACSQK